MKKENKEILKVVMSIYEKYHSSNGMIDNEMLDKTIYDISADDENLYKNLNDEISKNEKWKRMMEENMTLTNKHHSCLPGYSKLLLLLLSLLTIVAVFFLEKYIVSIIILISGSLIYHLYTSEVKYIYQYHKKIYLELMDKLSNKKRVHFDQTLIRLNYWLSNYTKRLFVTDIILFVASVVIYIFQNSKLDLITTVMYIMLLVDYIKQHFEKMNEINLEKIDLNSKLTFKNNKMYSFIIKIILKNSYEEKMLNKKKKFRN